MVLCGLGGWMSTTCVAQNKTNQKNQDYCNSDSHQSLSLSSNYIKVITKVSKENNLLVMFSAMIHLQDCPHNHVLRRPSHQAMRTNSLIERRPRLPFHLKRLQHGLFQPDLDSCHAHTPPPPPPACISASKCQ